MFSLRIWKLPEGEGEGKGEGRIGDRFYLFGNFQKGIDSMYLEASRRRRRRKSGRRRKIGDRFREDANR